MNTILFGEIPVIEEKYIAFNEGIPGFEHLTKFVLIQEESSTYFFYLQSVEEKEICFIMISPWGAIKEYDLKIPQSVEEKVGFGTELEVYLIVTVNENPLKTTINMQAPIIINPETNKGYQMILEGSENNLRKLLIEAINKETLC